MPGIAIAEAPQRILALTPHACEILYAIHAQAQLVGSVAYCDYPEAANALPRVGSYAGINVEAALRLKPDMAIVMSRNVKGVTQLEAMGIPVEISNPTSFHEVFADILRLGRLTGHDHDASSLVRCLQKRLDKVRAQPRTNTAVFYELWSEPLLTAGKPSFIHALIDEAGGNNVFGDIDIETPQVNIESVLRAKPTFIVIPLENRNIEARIAFWEHWLGKGHVHFAAIDPDIMHRPGPRLLDGLEKLQQALLGLPATQKQRKVPCQSP